MTNDFDRRAARRFYLMVFFSALLLYTFTCAPGALWQDSGMYQYRIWEGDIEGGLGLALSHPLYHIIGMAVKSIPFGEYGFRVNMISAVCGAMTAANLFLLVWMWGKNLFAAVLAAMTLGLGWTFWQHSVIAECYTLYTAVFSTELVCLYLYLTKNGNRWLYLTAFLNGLSISNHMWGILPLGVYAVLLLWLIYKKRLKISALLPVIGLWVAGAGIYITLIINAIARGDSWAATLGSALFGDGWGGDVLNASLTGRIAAENMVFIFYNFATPNILLVIGGFYFVFRLCRRKIFPLVFIAVTGLFFVFAFRYTVPDRYAFFIPFYFMVSVLVGIGAKLFLERFRNKAFPTLSILFSVLPVFVYIAAPVIAEKQGVNLGTARDIPYRNDYTYFLRPWKGGDNSPEKFASDAFSVTGEGDTILADGTTVYALWYVKQFDDKGAGVKVLSGHGSYDSPAEFPENSKELLEMMKNGDVFVVSPVKGYCPDFILEGFNFQKASVLYKVVEKN
jgi:hypothetical protein